MSPRRDGPVAPLHELSIEDRKAEDQRYQAHWYRLLGGLCVGKSVFDMGAGSGYGMAILREMGAGPVAGCDLMPLSDQVMHHDHLGWSPRSYDVVAAVDVIEHVEDDAGFLGALLNMAREAVFLSTPNWDFSHCVNQRHVREYDGAELLALIGERDCRWWTSDEQCQVSEGFNLTACNFGVLIKV